MATGFLAGLGQTIAGGIACGATLGLNEDVKRWTKEAVNRMEDNAEKAWEKDGEVTKFAESLPGIYRSKNKTTNDFCWVFFHYFGTVICFKTK